MNLYFRNYSVIEFDIPFVERDENNIKFNLPDPNLRRYGVTCKVFWKTRHVYKFDVIGGFYTRKYEDLLDEHGDFLRSHCETLEKAVELCEYCESYDTLGACWQRVQNHVRRLFSLSPKHKTMTLDDAKAELAVQVLTKQS